MGSYYPYLQRICIVKDRRKAGLVVITVLYSPCQHRFSYLDVQHGIQKFRKGRRIYSGTRIAWYNFLANTRFWTGNI